MSIGLSDLKKKASKVKKSAPEKESYPAGAWAAPQPTTTRPWSGENLKKPVADRSGAVMNEEWSSTHAAPLFWFDVNESPLLTKVQNGLLAIEERVEATIFSPLRTLKKFLGH
jgi:hypothetical protein